MNPDQKQNNCNVPEEVITKSAHVHVYFAIVVPCKHLDRMHGTYMFPNDHGVLFAEL